MELAPFRKIVDMRPGVLRAVRVQMELAPFGEIVGTRPGVLRAMQVQMELAPFCYVHRVFGHFLAGQGYANRGGMSGFSDAEWEEMRQRAEELRREKGPTSYAIQELNDDTRARIRELIRRAVH